MKVVILPTLQEVAEYGAQIFKQQLLQKPSSVLGLATGSTPLSLYQQLINAYQQGDTSFKQAVTFNLDEYLGIDGQHPQSYRYYMRNELFEHIDIKTENTFVPDGSAVDPFAACELYEQQIQQCGGIDIQLLGIGRNGHIGFNEPSSSLASRTRVKALTKETIDDNARFFQADEYQPHLSITMGIGSILRAKKIVLLATGLSKAKAIAQTVEGSLTASCPASALQMHQHATVIIDQSAASELKNIDFYLHLEYENQRLLQRLANR